MKTGNFQKKNNTIGLDEILFTDSETDLDILLYYDLVTVSPKAYEPFTKAVVELG